MGTRSLPTGTVTFLFTDVEGSTRLLHALGADGYAAALAEHRRLLRDAFAAHGGVEVDTEGDAFFVAFPTAPGALAAARQATEALATGPIQVRIGLQTGTARRTDEGYVGPDVHKGARIAAAGHGGQILLSSATAALLDGAELRDVGLHRLKDLTAPQRIYQADGDDHPPLKSLHQTNLPVPATPFLGREGELAALATLLADQRTRLLTLTGPGGTGKTRLALQAAADAADEFPDGVWWVPLAPLRDPSLVLPTAAGSLGASGELAEHIGDKRLLLLFDNFEHLVAAAVDLAPLLSACPHLALLVTSREPLHLAGEHEYAVDPLQPAEAVELFLARAVAARRDFVAKDEVAALCARLDHLPLAIELAAARVKVLSPVAMLERLERRLPFLAGAARDLPERQRTLRATIEWSHELLTPDEQRLFARLAVLRGGTTLEAAEAIAGADLDTLESLVDKSLLRVRDTGRFWMLETIREFAAERLEASGEADELRRSHADFFLALAEELQPRVMRDEPEALDRIEADHDNVRAAFDRLLARRDGERMQRLAAALWRFWYVHSHWAEGLRRLEEALGLDERPTGARASSLRGASVMAMNVGNIPASIRYAEAALALDRELGNEWGVAYATMMIGNCLWEAYDETRDLPAARDRLAEAADLFERLGDEHYALIARHNMAWIVGELGDRAEMKRLDERNLAVARRIGNWAVEADCLAGLGLAARDEGRLDDAVGLFCESTAIHHSGGRKADVARNFGLLSDVFARRGDLRDAARLLALQKALHDQLGADLPWKTKDRAEETLSLIQAGLDAESVERATLEGTVLSIDDAMDMVGVRRP